MWTDAFEWNSPPFDAFMPFGKHTGEVQREPTGLQGNL